MGDHGVEFYGAVTVSERGQIVIPAQARRDLAIGTGEKLLVMGGPAGGILLIKARILDSILARWIEIIHRLENELEVSHRDEPIE